MTAAFQLDNIKINASGKTILSVPSLSLDAGRITAVVGPNGAGKSTLLRLLNVLNKPTEGMVRFFGENLIWGRMSRAKQLEQQRQMSFVFQKSVMFDTTVFHNVAMGLKFRKWKKSDINDEVMRALEWVGLSDFRDRHAHTLSGGETQRVALARSIVTQPRVLLLDEATANLDPECIEIFEDVIHRIRKESGTTIVMITHNLQQAKRMADICLFMHQGEVLEMAETEVFFDRPAAKRLQDFLAGRMVY
ncbi:ABC transporter ATP-binding protein [Ferviditalea candida]|uniref:Phosphate ABC transporter ATP-binding protein n=1 Tax=Ferviditalea candida TaxID=3108399 RepID=A0ABU5ZI64_9BACL|nr:phosphate ABC transporter ATP-binding protein [Paenibacillaceae bacterium T2]